MSRAWAPGEDVASLAAAHQLDLPVRLLACLGFGLDAHHHVCHAYVLEAAAELTAARDFLGAFSLLAGMPELQSWRRRWITPPDSRKPAPVSAPDRPWRPPTGEVCEPANEGQFIAY